MQRPDVLVRAVLGARVGSKIDPLRYKAVMHTFHFSCGTMSGWTDDGITDSGFHLEVTIRAQLFQNNFNLTPSTMKIAAVLLATLATATAFAPAFTRGVAVTPATARFAGPEEEEEGMDLDLGEMFDM